MADTLKDFLIGVGFDVDEAGARQADSAIGSLQDAARSLYELLAKTAQSVRGLLSEFSDTGETGTDSMESAAQAAAELSGSEQAAAAAAADLGAAQAGAATSLDKVSVNARKAAGGLSAANKQAKMDGAKKGAGNLKDLENGLKKAADAAKKLMAAAAAALIGSGIGSAIRKVYEFEAGLAENAKTLKMNIEQTRAYQTALDAMGKTADEIKNSKSLTQTFNDLRAIGEQMALPAAAQGMQNIQRLKDGLTQLRVVANYAMQWIYYKIQEVAAGPLKDVQGMITGLRQWFGGNMEKIATGVAKVFGGVAQVITSVVKALGFVLKGINALPGPIKIAGAVALAIIAAVKSPLTRIGMVVAAVGLLIDDLVTYMEGGDSLFGGFWGPFLNWVEEIRPVVEEFISDFSAGLEAIGSAIQWLVDTLGGDLLLGIGLVAAALWTLSANPVILIIAAVIALIAGLGHLIKNWDKVKEKAEEVWNAVKDWCVGAWNSIKEAWDQVTGYFAGIWEAITSGEGLGAVLEAITAPFVSAYNTIKEKFDDIKKAAAEKWAEIKAAVKSFMVKLGVKLPSWETIKASATRKWEEITGAIKDFFVNLGVNLPSWETIKTTVSTKWAEITGAIADFFVSLGITLPSWESIKTTVSTKWAEITGAVSDFFVNLGISLPSWEEIKTTVSTKWSEITGAIADFFVGIGINLPSWDSIKTTVSSKWAEITGTIADFLVSIGINLPSWDEIKETVSSKWAEITGAIADFLVSIGINLPSWDTIKTTVSSKWTEITGAIADFFVGIGVNLPSWDTIKTTVTTKWAEITGAVSDFLLTLGITLPTWEDISAALTETFATVQTWFTENVVDKIKGAFDGITEWFSNTFGQAWKAVTDLFGQVGEWATGVWNGIKGGVESAVQGVYNAAVAAGDWIVQAGTDVGDFFKNGWQSIFGGGEQPEPVEVEVDTAQVEEAQSAVEAFQQALEGVTESGALGTWYQEQFTSITETVTESAGTVKDTLEELKTGVDAALPSIQTTVAAARSAISDDLGKVSQVVSALRGVVEDEAAKIVTALASVSASTITSTFNTIRDNIASSMAESVSAVTRQVAAIKRALAGIPGDVNINVGATKTFGVGGVVNSRTKAEVGDDGKEYIIPVNKPGRAKNLLRQAARDLGMSAEGLKGANAMLGGDAAKNTAPTYASGTVNNQSTTNNININAPANMNVQGTEARAIARTIQKNHEDLIMRNVKSALA